MVTYANSKIQDGRFSTPLTLLYILILISHTVLANCMLWLGQMGCFASKEKTVNKESKKKNAKDKTSTHDKSPEPLKTVQPSTAFEIPLDNEKPQSQGIKKLPPLTSQKKTETVKPPFNSVVYSNQEKNEREKELNSKMEKAEQNKQLLLQQKRDKSKKRDENISKVRERRNSLSEPKQ